MQSEKEFYESPRSTIVIVEMQGIVCQSPKGSGNESVEDDNTIIGW